jgi:hypothetical protein
MAPIRAAAYPFSGTSARPAVPVFLWARRDDSLKIAAEGRRGARLSRHMPSRPLRRPGLGFDVAFSPPVDPRPGVRLRVPLIFFLAEGNLG